MQANVGRAEQNTRVLPIERTAALVSNHWTRCRFDRCFLKIQGAKEKEADGPNQRSEIGVLGPYFLGPVKLDV